MRKVLLFLIIGFSATASAAKTDPAYRSFVDACTGAFAKSSPASPGEENPGISICECTADESRHQGVTVPELKKETVAISQDPKYKIANKKLLAAFHYCTISAMHGLSGEDSH